jgi:hypothetical protein
LEKNTPLKKREISHCLVSQSFVCKTILVTTKKAFAARLTSNQQPLTTLLVSDQQGHNGLSDNKHALLCSVCL